MPKGLYGARHFEKHGWKLPIPRYEANDPLHASLRKLGKTAEQDVNGGDKVGRVGGRLLSIGD